MDLTVAESKAAYEEIKAYMKEKTGKTRQPECPEAKEKAVRETLQYFIMGQSLE